MTIPRVTLRKIDTKNGYVYTMDYTVNGVRKRTRIGSNKRIAESIRAQKQTELTLGKYSLLPEEKLIISFSSLFDNFLSYHKDRKKPSTVNRYKNHLIPYLDFITNYFKEVETDVRLIKPSYIDECIGYLIKDKKPKVWAPYTVNRSLQTLSSMFIFAIEREYIAKNPCTIVKKLKVPKKEFPEFFSEEEINNIWETLDPFWIGFFKFLCYTGLRKGEIINLKWGRVYLDKSPVEIRVANTEDWDPKTNSSIRTVPLNKKAVAVLKQQIGVHPEYVFVSKKGKRIHPNSPYETIVRACKQLGIIGGVHKFRHTFASHLVMNGANLYELKELLGHSTIEMTQKYAHLSPKHKESVVSVLDKLNI